ncbi:MAG: prepilin-type N-terminal cleavage/methylation domain-containing protein [Armatimonadota bacterium]|nr:prepilin-type N-terminal cleavage/methylation domain-containing protein [Armatimonadota bacterium]
MRKSAAKGGFTLVEVLVATGVVALGLVAALTAFSMATRVRAVSSNDTIVAFLAQQKLAEIQLLGPEQLPAGADQGDFGPEFPQYLWKLTVHEPDDVNVVPVDLIISTMEAGRKREVRFTTAIF